MTKPPFVKNQIYHIYNRGVEKRDIFMDKQDYLRFIHCLFALNDQASFKNLTRISMSQVGLDSLEKYNTQKRKPRKLLVEILVFCLMPNHFHLMLRQKTENGIVRFMQKLGTAHAKYFNQKYDRVGPLFQGKFKAVLVEKNAHFLYLPHYIHINPLDLMGSKKMTSNTEKIKFLEKYKWSSLPDYMNIKNFPSVTQRDFLLETFKKNGGYRNDVEKCIKTSTEDGDFNLIRGV